MATKKMSVVQRPDGSWVTWAGDDAEAKKWVDQHPEWRPPAAQVVSVDTNVPALDESPAFAEFRAKLRAELGLPAEPPPVEPLPVEPPPA